MNDEGHSLVATRRSAASAVDCTDLRLHWLNCRHIVGDVGQLWLSAAHLANDVTSAMLTMWLRQRLVPTCSLETWHWNEIVTIISDYSPFEECENLSQLYFHLLFFYRLVPNACLWAYSCCILVNTFLLAFI